MKTKKLITLFGALALSTLALTAHAEGNVAKIGDTEYATLGDAFASATAEPTTVTLIGDITDTSTITLAEGKNVILDLAGHKITAGYQSGSTVAHDYALDNRGTLTIKDSVGTSLISARGMYNKGNGKMTIESGNFESIDSNGGGACVWNEADLTVTGGSFAFTGNKSGNNAGACIINNKKADITGGEFTSRYICIFNQNGGTLDISNATMTRPAGSDYYFQTIKSQYSTVILNNVTINALNGGGIEAAGGSATINNCTINVTTPDAPTDHNATCIAVSNGGTININGGTYTSEKFGFYVFNSGGTINIDGDTTLKADKVALKADYNNQYNSKIVVNSGKITGAIEHATQAEIIANGGSFSDTANLTIADGKLLTENGDVVEGQKLEASAAFNQTEGETTTENVGRFFNVTTAAGKTTAVATFKDGDKTASDTLKLPAVDGEGNIAFSILLIGATENVTGQIIYQ